MLFLVAFLIFVTIVGASWFFGMWNSLLNLMNFFIAALIASSMYEVLAWEIQNFDSSYDKLADFVAVWLIFAGSFIVLRAATDLLSRYQLKVDPVIDMIGRGVFSVWLAGAFICFTFFTLHLAPLPPNGYQADLQSRVIGIGPDRFWLAFIQSRSRGGLAASKTSPGMPEYTLFDHPDDEGRNMRVFDPDARFIHNNYERRKEWSQQSYLRTGRQ